MMKSFPQILKGEHTVKYVYTIASSERGKKNTIDFKESCLPHINEKNINGAILDFDKYALAH